MMNIMQKKCAIIVIINMEELKNLGIVSMKNYMLVVYVKIAILINIIKKKE
jgi:hypothetical protein